LEAFTQPQHWVNNLFAFTERISSHSLMASSLEIALEELSFMTIP